MSITHHLVLHCDQNPLPNRCRQTVTLMTGHEDDAVLIDMAIRAKDWAEVDINGKKAHYCPYHRPVP